jgi:hypothetical protein
MEDSSVMPHIEASEMFDGCHIGNDPIDPGGAVAQSALCDFQTVLGNVENRNPLEWHLQQIVHET